MRPPSFKPSAFNAPPDPKIGDRHVQNRVELEWNGRNWLPVLNPENYPKLFNRDGSRKT